MPFPFAAFVKGVPKTTNTKPLKNHLGDSLTRKLDLPLTYNTLSDHRLKKQLGRGVNQ